MTFNILFLDVDGVLNNSQNFYKNLEQTCFENLKDLVEDKSIKIVISSTWRFNDMKMKKLYNELNKYGINNVVGMTENLMNRTEEILKWVSINKKHIKNWVAIDDMLLKLDNKHFHQVDYHYGLTKEDVNQIKDLFI